MRKARIIAEQTEQLSADQAGREGRVLQRAATQTPGQLRRSVRRAVAKADPAALRRRHQAAKRERGVSLWELPDGTAMISSCPTRRRSVPVDDQTEINYSCADAGTPDTVTAGQRCAAQPPRSEAGLTGRVQHPAGLFDRPHPRSTNL